MAKITISKNKKLPFDAKSVTIAVLEVLKQTGNYLVEVNMVDEETIKTVNKEFRDKDAVTDVLSFPTLDGIRYKNVTAKDFPLDLDESGKRVFLGSIIICLNRAKEQAVEFNHSLDRELCYLLTHGLLHLFGYDHIEDTDDKEMRSLANEVMEKIGIKR